MKLKHLQDWLEFAQQANWSVAKLAKLCGVTPRSLERHFRRNFGQPPKAWMVEHRQRHAVNLLQNGSLVKETASKLG